VEKVTHQVVGIPGAMNDRQLEEFLRSADIVGRESIGTGITKPEKLTLRKNGVTLSATYKYHDSESRSRQSSAYSAERGDPSDRYQYEVAAYKLDRFLDMHRVPVSVLRTIDGKEGVVQYWVPNTINERDRRKQNLAFSGGCDKDTQFRLRVLFDILIFNEDRNLTNMLYTREDFVLQLIDHSRSFGASAKRPRMYRRVTLELSELFKRRLQTLTRDNLSNLLGDYLHPRQIGAIIKRRDYILREAAGSD
jgi:hypothetical protein